MGKAGWQSWNNRGCLGRGYDYQGDLCRVGETLETAAPSWPARKVAIVVLSYGIGTRSRQWISMSVDDPELERG